MSLSLFDDTAHHDSNPDLSDKSAEDLFRLAKSLHAQVLDHAQTTLDCALRCGEVLLKAKSRCKHGEFGRMRDEISGLGKVQSAKYMRLAKNRDKIDGATSIADALRRLDDSAKVHRCTFSVPAPLDLERINDRDYLADIDNEHAYRIAWDRPDGARELLYATPSVHPGYFWLESVLATPSGEVDVTYATRPPRLDLMLRVRASRLGIVDYDFDARPCPGWSFDPGMHRDLLGPSSECVSCGDTLRIWPGAGEAFDVICESCGFAMVCRRAYTPIDD